MGRRLNLLLVTLVVAGCASAAPPQPAPLDRLSAPAPGPAPAVEATTPDSAPRGVLRLAPYLGPLRTVAVAVGDTTLPFIFDTGGGITLLTPAAAGTLGCRPFGRLVGFRHDGDPVALQRCPPVSLPARGWVTPPQEVGVYDLMGLLPDGVPALGGLMALNSFDGLAVTLALGEDRVVVESRPSLARRVERGRELAMREARQASGAGLDVFLAFAAPQGPLWFELDSGNAGPVLIAPHAAEQLGLDLSPTEPRAVTLTLEGYGPVTVQAREKEMVYDGLLNAAFLERFTVTLDLHRERAWIAP